MPEFACKTHREIKSFLHPHGHDEHEEDHAGRGREERWSGDEHARRGGGQKEEKPSCTSASQIRTTGFVTFCTGPKLHSGQL